ncbi:MAG: D-alanyl-D-alanine carboxypeptidase [Solirubrobacterales bacterium]|nr:D-alanyl-D-alanine carboxypeptidase [Solirubrobacterales bacterium]
MLVEPATGDIVFQRQAQDRRSIASTTKLMTALVVLDRLSLDDVLSQVPYRSDGGESLVGLREGERMTVRDYLRGLLLASGNDAAQTLAVRTAGSRRAFVRLMNERARQIGLRNTHFQTPVGLDVEGNYSTASDLVALALVLRTNAFIRETTNRPDATLRVRGERGRAIRVVNRNSLVRSVPFVNGVKTGHTSRAGYVLVGSATRAGVTVMSAVLGTPSEAARNRDSLALLRYGLQHYHVVSPVKKGQRLASARIRFRDGPGLALVAARTVQRTAKRGERLFTSVVDAPEEVEGPVPAGARLGTILVRQRGRTVDRVPLVAEQAVPATTATERLSDYGRRPGTLLLLAAFVGGSLLLVLLRWRSARRADAHGVETETA